MVEHADGLQVNSFLRNTFLFATAKPVMNGSKETYVKTHRCLGQISVLYLIAVPSIEMSNHSRVMICHGLDDLIGVLGVVVLLCCVWRRL